MAKPDPRPAPHISDTDPTAPPRILGGTMRGRKLLFQVDPRTRPMKERVRAALFDLLGPSIAKKHAIDLFAGTGALGFESLSRGAVSVTFVERHFPTAERIGKTAASLEIADKCQIIPGNSLLWSKKLPELPTIPWVVFCSPPYDLFINQQQDMLALINKMFDVAPAGSLFAVEADERFDMKLLPQPDRWLTRFHSPAMLAVLHNDDEATLPN